MDLTESIKTTPIVAQQSVRRNDIRALTSCQAGKIVPVCYAPMLREDRVSRGQLRVRVEMAETVFTLMNAINVTAYAHFVPFLAFDRFNGLDQLNRSYMGEPESDESVVPFFETMAFDREAPIFKTMGLHQKQGQPVNTAVVEAYNAIVNFRRKARSEKLPERTALDTTLARGFWRNPGLRAVVPDFDQAMIDGEVPLNIVNERLPIQGLARHGNGPAGTYYRTSDGGAEDETNMRPAYVDIAQAGIGQFPMVFAELAEQGVTLSLSNIEMAKRTAAFARIRKQYSGLDDEHIIDLLMQAVRVPDAQLSQPILLDRKSTVMGYAKRYATDGANLDQSVTTGETFLDLTMRTPAMNTGGLVVVTLEVTPEQLFERQEDHFLTAASVDELPSFTRDYLDPEKVAVVQNRHVDVEHSNPDGTFGYAPLNFEWQRQLPNIGGKFHRQLGDPFVEDRQRIWGVETVDPSLTEDFYLVGNLHQNVFADTTADPFEVVALGRFELVGNTVFGKGLHEKTEDYSKLIEQTDASRIDQEEAAP